MRTVAYTAICGGRDHLRHTGRPRPGGFVCFTDDPPPATPYLGWDIRPSIDMYRDPRLDAKRHQVLAHESFPDVDVSCYLDGSHGLAERLTVEGLAAEYLGYADLACFEHSERDCAYAEAAVCIERGRDDPDVIRAQMARYRAEGFPEHWGLPAITLLLRRHTAPIRAVNTAWWQEIMTGSYRDQLSFPYVCWRLGLRWETIPGNPFTSPLCHYVPHGTLISEGGVTDARTR